MELSKFLLPGMEKTVSIVKWSYSSSYSIKSGIRQGAILSPFLFNIYLDSITVALKQADNGCHMGGMYTGCLAYADDLILISASVVKLQKMLDICSTYGTNLDIKFNPLNVAFSRQARIC